MKTSLKITLVLLLVLLSNNILIAQGPPPPPPPPGLPINGGLVGLILAAIIYGVKKIKN